MGRYGVDGSNAIAPSARTRMTETVFADMMSTQETGFRRDGTGEQSPRWSSGWAAPNRANVTGRVLRGRGRHHPGGRGAGRAARDIDKGAPLGIPPSWVRSWPICWPSPARRCRFSAPRIRSARRPANGNAAVAGGRPDIPCTAGKNSRQFAASTAGIPRRWASAAAVMSITSAPTLGRGPGVAHGRLRYHGGMAVPAAVGRGQHDPLPVAQGTASASSAPDPNFRPVVVIKAAGNHNSLAPILPLVRRYTQMWARANPFSAQPFKKAGIADGGATCGSRPSVAPIYGSQITTGMTRSVPGLGSSVEALVERGQLRPVLGALGLGGVAGGQMQPPGPLIWTVTLGLA